MKKIKLRSMLAVFTALVIGISLCSCAAPSGTAQSDTNAVFRASALSDGYVRGFFGDRTVDADFADIYSEFSFALFDKLLTGEGENLFISSFSVMTCLGMLANGVRGETKAQIEAMLGAVDMFDRTLADFGDASELLGACNSVLHKTHIEVNRDGTRAAAVTGATYCAGINDTPVHRLVFDRPFVFMIVDDATGIPMFIGVVTNI